MYNKQASKQACMQAGKQAISNNNKKETKHMHLWSIAAVLYNNLGQPKWGSPTNSSTVYTGIADCLYMQRISARSTYI